MQHGVQEEQRVASHRAGLRKEKSLTNSSAF